MISWQTVLMSVPFSSLVHWRFSWIVKRPYSSLHIIFRCGLILISGFSFLQPTDFYIYSSYLSSSNYLGIQLFQPWKQYFPISNLVHGRELRLFSQQQEYYLEASHISSLATNWSFLWMQRTLVAYTVDFICQECSQFSF